MERMEANWGEVPQQVVVNGGFINQGTIMAMEAQGMDLIGPLPDHCWISDYFDLNFLINLKS